VYCKIDGTTYTASVTPYDDITEKGIVLFDKTLTILHNSNGSKSLTCSAWITHSQFSSSEQSYTQALTTIARASQPSCVTYPEHTQNVGEFGDTISIHMNRQSSSFTHTVRYAFGSLSGTCINAETGKAATGITTGVRWKIPESFMNLIPNTTSGSGTIYVDTYNGSTFIDTKSCGFTATVPATVKPTCSFTLDDTTGVDDIYGSPVQGLSKIKITVSANTAYSSPIASYSITANGSKYSTSVATTGFLNSDGKSTVTATVKDRRGRPGTVSYDMTVIAYHAPSISSLSVRRCNEDGTSNNRGDYIQAVFSAEVSPLNNKNTATYSLRYKKTGDSDSGWKTISFPDIANKYSVSNVTTVFAADGSSSYNVEVIVKDRHNTTPKPTTTSTAFTMMNFNAYGDGMGIGMVNEARNTLQVGMDFNPVANRYVYQAGGFSGDKGYTALAIITVKELNANSPITFVLSKRGTLCPMKVHIRFASSSTTTDPELDSFGYEGDNYGAFLVKTAISTWTLYVDNLSGWSNPCIQDWYTSESNASRITVTFPAAQVAELPQPWYRATPLVLRSIIDCVMPVGFVLTLYSYADPNTMYPGTTWVRISNSFLWAIDSEGKIGLTGGEKEHVLTTNEIPAHSHGSVYSQHATGTKDKAWYTASGTSVAYGPVSTGGGEAHNNMPPYIQVSVWRRTE
jgi:hypothetical protein